MAFNDGIYSISQYVECRPTLAEKISAIDALITAHELKLLDVIGNSDVDEYQMDDGQMKVRTKYRSLADVQKGLDALEILKQRYVNRLNGRRTVLRGGQF